MKNVNIEIPYGINQLWDQIPGQIRDLVRESFYRDLCDITYRCLQVALGLPLARPRVRIAYTFIEDEQNNTLLLPYEVVDEETQNIHFEGNIKIPLSRLDFKVVV